MRRRRALIVAAGLLSMVLAYYAGLFRFNYPTPNRYPIRGIDISHHQKQMSWYQASLGDVKFAYLKATEGADFRDRNFQFNWQQCERSGIVRGAYHFFNFCAPAEPQAKNFLAAVPPGASTLPPALDLEFSPNCKKVLSRQEMVKLVTSFSKALSGRYSEKPVFYVTPEWYRRYYDGHQKDFPPHHLWIRNILREPTEKPCEEWTFWQFADNARIPGIEGPVDLNVFCGSTEQFSELIRSRN